jgi:shikimate dehydrogenase
VTVTSSTRLIALLGNPVAHSISPLFQNAAFRAARVDGVYVALRCEGAAVPGLIRGIGGAGGGGNVTLPHKEIAAATVERRTAAVDRTGACNTYWMEEGILCGDNTDVPGAVRAVRGLLGQPATGARVLLIGGGGAARAAMAAMEAEGAAEVIVVNRTQHRAEELARLFQDAAFRVSLATEDRLPPGHFDLVINSTSLGLHEADPLPLVPPAMSVGAAFDMAYRPGGTAWVKRLRDAGVRAADGREMLLWQGAAAFERWWGLPAPVEEMRAALEKAIS